MMFLFASMNDQASGWPVDLIHRTEAAFVMAAFGSILLGAFLRRILPYQLFAITGGIAAGFGLIMPFELAPFFFGARGEVMLGTVALILVYPVAVVVFILLFLKLLRPHSA